jgi:hypothetical protein
MLAIYLDSQDYSALSEPQLTPELGNVKNALLNMAEAGEVRFVFSALVVCEAVPTGSHAVQFAIRRGDFLSQLCQRNALISPTELVEQEVSALAQRSVLPKEAVGPTQDWFPHVEFDAPTPLADLMREQFNADPATKAMTRAQRREAERKLFKKGALRPEVRKQIYLAAGDGYVQAIAAKWPMDLSQADVFRRYALGESSKDEAAAAMRASLRDPSRLMRWFVENPELAKPLGDMVRGPGRTLGNAMRSLVAFVEDLETEGESGLVGQSMLDSLPFRGKVLWEDWVSGQVDRAVRGMALESGVELRAHHSAADFASYCPGIDAMVRSMLSSVWDNIGGNRRQLPSDSQFPDAMHAMYAPYVDVFRADSYMAPHIRAQVERHGTRVVAKVRDLPAVLASLLPR